MKTTSTYLHLTLILWACIISTGSFCQAANTPRRPIKLWACDAILSGGTRLLGKDTLATIHGWNNLQQTIGWKTRVESGKYIVRLCYAEPYPGSNIQVSIGDSQITYTPDATAGWQEYKELSIGLIESARAGEVDIRLQGTRLATATTPNGKERPEALPDILSLTLVPKEETGYTCYGKLTQGVPHADALGWKVGIQSYTFHKFSLFEAIDMTAALGLNYIEATIWMRLYPGKEDRLGIGMSAGNKAKLKQKLAESGIKAVSLYQRLDGKKDPEGAERTFRFCKEMGFMLVTDPERVPTGNGSMDFYESLCKKYDVTMVLTNHPKRHNSPYWNPEDVLEDCKGRDKRIGASVDLGHFMRDGYAPLDIVKKYIEAGRMYHFHFRDVDAVNSGGKDVPVGEGAGQTQEIIRQLRLHDIRPVMVLEYERDFYNQMLYLIPSLNTLNKWCGEKLKP